MAGDAVCMAIFSVDMILRSQFWGRELLMKNWFRGQLVVVVLTSLDLISRDMTRLQWTGFLRPYVLFYYFKGCRQNMGTTLRSLPGVVKVILLELYIILIYACICFLVYRQSGEDGHGSFSSLSWSFINLFELSTTVNNPDVWLKIYHRNHWNALVFVSFMVVILYFIHNVVIAKIYENYRALSGMRLSQMINYRLLALNEAFQTLSDDNGFIAENRLKLIFKQLRPHYSDDKLDVLYSMMTNEAPPSSLETTGIRGFDAFKMISRCVNTRVRNRRPP